MPDDRIPTWFETLLDDGPSEAERSEAETQLEASLQGRRLLTAYRWLSGPVAVDEAAAQAQRVMQQLPEFGQPETYLQLANLVLAAWARPELRAQLYRDARQGLAEAGFRLPESAQIEIVPAEAARLPRGNRIFLPLPPEDGPAIPEHSARRALQQTEFAWIWGPPWQQGEAQRAAMQPSGSGRLMSWIHEILGAPAWRLALAGLGSVAILASGLILAGRRTGVILGSLSGSALGNADVQSMLGMAGLLVGMIALGFAIYGRRG